MCITHNLKKNNSLESRNIKTNKLPQDILVLYAISFTYSSKVVVHPPVEQIKIIQI